MTFEEAIVAGIVAEFFKSQPGSADANGSTYWTPAPAMSIAHALYNAHKDEILAAVIAALDVDDLASKIAVKVTADLLAEPSLYGPRSTDIRNIQKDIRSAVIDKVAQAQADELRAQMQAERTA